MGTLVIRLSSLGDVVLAGAVTGGLGPVTFLTKAAYAPVAAALPGVRDVWVYGQPSPHAAYERVVDLHASLRSRRISAGRKGPVRRVQRYDLRRRLRVWFKGPPPAQSVVERYARAAQVPPQPVPWIHAEGPRDTLFLVPGAAHATKRPPPALLAAAAADWAGPILVLGGPGEQAEVGGLAHAIGHRAEALAERGFGRTLAALGRGALAVGGDTGPMHLCAAAGIPTVTLFGPTTVHDGFWAGRTEPVSLDLDCRPCSRHGGPSCPIGDHRCLQALPLAAVQEAMARARP